MNRTKEIFSIAPFFSIVLAVTLMFNLSHVEDATSPPILSATPTSESTTVFTDPDKIVKDYLLEPGYQIGDTFQIRINISDVTNIFAWNINITWNPEILNFTKLVSYGDFLAQTTSPYGTSSSIVDIINASNETGYAAIAETILGDYPGVNGSGQLVTIEFLIVGYGSTNLTISVGGPSPTELVDSNIDSIAFTAISSYFRNKLVGDANGDKTVDIFDIGTISAHWYPGPPVGPLGYGKEADINLDGAVDIFDIGITSSNWGRTVP